MTNFTFQNGITPVNGPLMDRKRTVNGPSVSWKLFTLLFALFLCVGQMWGTNYSYTPNGTYSASGGNTTSNNIQWTYSSATYCGNNSSKIQIGSQKKPQTSAWTIQTAVSNFGSNKKVTSISLTAYTTATTATYDISAGGSSVKSGSLTTSSAPYTANNLNVTSGNIVITMTGSSSSKAMYLCGITVVYEDNTSGTKYTVTYDANGGSVTPSSHTQASAGASITTPTPTKTGYSCTGWWTSTSGGTKRCNAGGSYTPTASETVHAQWACISPTINTQPASANYAIGASPAALSVSATLSSGTLTYLWKVSTNGGSTWSNASGTNNLATYAAANISTASAGTTKYKCIVTNSSGSCSTESDVATITVYATHKVYFYNGSTLLNTGGTDVAEGAAVSYSGSDPESCDTGTGASNTFVGWATGTWDDKKAAKGNIPDGITFYDITASETLPNMSTSDVNYYAVFAKSSGGGSTTLLSEDFSSITGGDNTTTGGNGTAWTKNDNFSSISRVNEAGGAVRLGTGTYVGYLVTKQLTAAIGDQITISFKVKGWSSVEGNIQVSGNNSEFTTPSNITYTATMSGSFQSKSVTVTLTKANPYIKIATTAKRAFLDDIVITKPGSTTYSNYMTTCCTPLGQINGAVTKTQDGTSMNIKNWGYTPANTGDESHISKYTVYLYSDQDSYTSPIGNGIDCAVANRANAGVTFSDLSYARTYKVKITATPANNYCPVDEAWSTTFRLTCATPTAATAGSFDRTNQQMPITWTSGADKVDICYSANSNAPAATPGSGYTVVSNQTSSPVNLNVSGLAAGNYYCWVRSVCDASNKSNWTAITGNTFSIPTHTLTIAKDGDGTITPASGTAVVEGRTASIEATPATGFAFDHWAVSGTNASLSSTTDNPTTFTMGTADATVTAYFECVEPEVTADPADADYYIGDEPEDLSVSATLASGTLTYLWKVSTDGGTVWGNAEGTNNEATYSDASLSTASEGTLKFKCIVGNSEGGCTVESAVATITVSKASYFPNGKTIFIQAHSTSAWTGGGCVKAWFHTAGGSETAQSTYWLFDATGDDTGKKLFATVVPASGNLPYMDIQRFASNCNDWWNKNGGCSYADAEGSNTVRSFNKHDDSSEGNYVAWNGSGVTMNLMSSDAWLTPVAAVTDQGAGVWTGTYEYTPTNTSTEYVIATNYNGNIGNKVDNDHQNENAVLSDMIVGSTYNVTAMLNVITHALTMSKEFVKGEVKFDLQDHGSAIAKLTDVTAGSTISAPSAPSATGYTFGGWFKEPACTNEWDFDNDVVNETMTLYAKWTANTYTITKTFSNVANAGLPASFVYTGHTTTDLNSTFTVDGDNFFLPNSITVTMGGSTLAAGTDYTYDNSNGAFTFDKIIDGNIVITASATAKLKSIAITTQPNTRKYFVGENFSNTGAVVTATMGDGSNKTVTANWTAPATPLAAGTGLTVTASYTENGINMTANTTIDVYSVTVKTTDPDGVEFTVAGVTATWTVGTKALAAGVGSTNYVFKEWEVTGATIGSTTNANTTLSNPTADVVVNAKFYKPIAIEWKVGANDATGGTREVKRGTQLKNLTLPSDPDDDDLSLCIPEDGKFMGWSEEQLKGDGHDAPDDLFTSLTATTAITSNKTFYAVFAKAEEGDPVYTKVTSVTEGTYVMVSEKTSNTYRYMPNTASETNPALSSGITMSTTAGVTTLTNTITADMLWDFTTGETANYFYVRPHGSTTIGLGTTNSTGANIRISSDYKDEEWRFTTSANYGWEIYNGAHYLSAYSDNEWRNYGNNSTNQNGKFYLFKQSTSVSYSDYQTGCCTPLGTIDGEIALSNEDCAAGELKATWKMKAVTGIASQVLHIYKASDNSEVTAKKITDIEPSTSNQTKTISGLDNCTAYYVKVENISNGGDYCASGMAGDQSDNATTKGYSYTINPTNVSLKSGETEAENSCEDFLAEYVANTGYVLPSTIMVTGASSYDWEGGVLAIEKANVTGNVSVTIIGTCITPNITADPESAVYALNAEADPLSVTVEGAGEWCGYQWESKVGNGNWTPIQNATSSSYMPSTASAGSTTLYHVIVSNTASGCSTSSTSQAATISVSSLPICAQPTFSPTEGTKEGAQNITLSCETNGATIYYTTNGDDPQEIAANLYSGAIAVNQTTTIKAIAAKSGMTTSAVVSATYTIKCKAPTFSVDEGTYNVAKSVELASDYGTVYYTTDGSDPATNGVAYSGAISVEASTTIRAIAKMANCLSSDEASATYTLKCATPTFSVAAGTHTGVQNVELACATDGAAIHYTTNGNTPTGSSPTYSSAIAVSSAQTIKAIATKDGWSNSDVAEAAYTIQYTVTWKVGGVALSGAALGDATTLVNAGGKVSKFPSVADDALSTCIPTNGRFMGWNASEVKTPSDDAPAYMFSKTDGTIPTVSENVTYYAVFAEVVAGGDEWVETAIGSIASSDVVVIATPGGYAVSNDNGTSSAPTAVGITVSEGKITSTVANNIKWNIGGNATNGYIFYPNGTTSTWLYCNTTQSSGSNNNIRVGTGDRKYWIADSDGDYGTKDNNTKRWLCNYDNSDFRGYVGSSVTSDIVGKFYKKTSSVSISDYQTGCCTDPTTALSITGATSVALNNTLSLGTTGGNGGDVTWSVTNGTGSATISDAGVLSPLSVGTVTVKAHQDETNGKCEQNPTVEITIVAATVHVSSVEVTPETVALLPGETAQLSTTVSPDDATDKSIKSWVSGTPATATVNASGLVTAVVKGTSTITATTNDGDFTDNCAVTVYGLTILKQDEDGETISAGVTASATLGRNLSASAGETQYVFKGWKYAENGDGGLDAIANASNTSITLTGTPTGDVTIIAEFYKPRVVKWSVNNDDTFAETTVAYGGSISSVPAVTSGLACASTFIAWTDAAHNNGETAKDDDSYYGEALYKAASDFPTNITEATTTYYAVFANTSGKAGYFYIGDDGVLEEDEIYIFVNSLSGDLLGNAKALEATTLTTVYTGSTGIAVDVTITSEPGVKYVSTFNENLEFECTSIVDETNKKVTLEIVKNTPASNYNLHVNGSGIGRGAGQVRYNASGLQGWNGAGTTFYDVYYNSTSDKFEKAADAGARVYAYKKQTASYAGYVTQCDMTKAKLTYVTPGGVPGCAETEVIFTKGEPVTICSTQPTPPTGYQFEEWNTETDGSGDTYAAGETIPAEKTGDNITLTAQWTPVTYNITYHLDGGTNGANPDTYTIETADIELVAATREHDRFEGWFTDNGVWENQVTTIALGSHENIELYAKWTSRYEIQFKAADVTVGTIWRAADEELNALVEGQGSEPSVTAPSLCGKMFAGWTKNQIEDIVEDAPADFMEEAIGTVNSNTIFYAVWADATPTTFTKVCDWEAASIPAEWKVSASIERTINQGYDGTYGGKINTNHTYVQFNHKVNATEFSFALRRTSNNTNGTVYVETSTDNSNWTAAETYEMSAFEESYTVKTKTFDGLSKLYVRFHCSQTTALRYVDNVTIKYNNYAFTNYTTACHVTAASEQTVNVEESNTISSLTVKQDGMVNLGANLTVTDFTIEAMEGHSGQVLNPNNLHINGNAYYDLTLNTSGAMDNSKWYAFAVPFQIDAATGIQRLSNDGVASTAQFNGHYVLLKYNSEERAKGNTGWQYVTAGEKLMPGRFYMVALNSNAYNRLRMTKDADVAVNNLSDLNLSEYTDNGAAATDDKNWNALANNALAYANVSAEAPNASLKVQTYISATNVYDVFAYDEVTFTVGTPFFVQAAASGTMDVTIAASNNETVKAPKFYDLATEEFQIRLGADTESYYDKLYVSASEEALDEYQIGHDLAKAGVSTTVPQMYVPAYGSKLCDAEFPLVNNQAVFPLTFTTPTAGTYQLYVKKAAQDAKLYLLRDGNVIWDLTMSAYAIELPQGTTENYSLKIVAAPKTPTGLENTEYGVQNTDVQKVIINDQVFILRGGQMYDVTGKMVK